MGDNQVKSCPEDEALRTRISALIRDSRETLFVCVCVCVFSVSLSLSYEDVARSWQSTIWEESPCQLAGILI